MELLKLNIRRWFEENRPELNSIDRAAAAKSTFLEIEDDVKDMPIQGQILYTNQYLIQNYLKSPYNFIKDVFEEHNSKEFYEYQRTPIFYDVNDEILTHSLKKGLIKSPTAILTEEEFYHPQTRQLVTEVIDYVINKTDNPI